MPKEQKIDSINNYRPSGQLESFGVEKLPPTPITRAAEYVLKKMGLTKAQIKELREFTSAFRYDRCAEKVQRLASSKVYVEKSDGEETVKFPYYFDTNGRIDGQCGDIARQYIVLAEFTGLIDDLNEDINLPRGNCIAITFCHGQSKTHFCKDDASHVWNEIVQLDDDDYVVRSVLVDAAFQKIMTPDESGYKERGSGFLDELDMKLVGNVLVGTISIDGPAWTASAPKSLVLGISNDRKYSYALTFARRNHEDKSKRIIIPILHRGMADASGQFFFYSPDTSDLLVSWSAKQSLPNSREIEEIERILGACQEFEFTEDLSSYPFPEKGSHIVRLSG